MNKSFFYISIFLVGFFLSLHFRSADAAQSDYARNSLDAYAPFEELLNITASDDVTYDPPLRGCIIESDGNLQVTPVKNSSPVTLAVIGGQVLPIIIETVNSATTATISCGR